MSFSRSGRRSRAGFTILELMISVAIIGLLAAIAIPNFLHYQANARRSEAYGNVQAIANLETTYFGEFDAYFAVPVAMPNWLLKPSGVLDTTKMAWDAASQAAFAGLGWAPEGQVFYSYEIVADCNGDPAFTVSAAGDVDADTFPGGIQYGKPDTSGSLCIPNSVPLGPPLRGEEVLVNGSGDAH